MAKGESHVTLEGGTHNPLAPPFDFLAKTYLPLISRRTPGVSPEMAPRRTAFPGRRNRHSGSCVLRK